MCILEPARKIGNVWFDFMKGSLSPYPQMQSQSVLEWVRARRASPKRSTCFTTCAGICGNSETSIHGTFIQLLPLKPTLGQIDEGHMNFHRFSQWIRIPGTDGIQWSGTGGGSKSCSCGRAPSKRDRAGMCDIQKDSNTPGSKQIARLLESNLIPTKNFKTIHCCTVMAACFSWCCSILAFYAWPQAIPGLPSWVRHLPSNTGEVHPAFR